VRCYLEDGSVGERGWWRASGEWCGEPKTHVHTSLRKWSTLSETSKPLIGSNVESILVVFRCDAQGFYGVAIQVARISGFGDGEIEMMRGHYSYLKATMGSTRTAWRAGM
jgi:hypothetical protein